MFVGLSPQALLATERFPLFLQLVSYVAVFWVVIQRSSRHFRGGRKVKLQTTAAWETILQAVLISIKCLLFN